jgi:Zn-dependent protease with chaperone function
MDQVYRALAPGLLALVTVWFCAGLGLYAVARVQDQLAFRAYERLVVGSHRALEGARFGYRMTLRLCCLYYYVSIPIAVLVFMASGVYIALHAVTAGRMVVPSLLVLLMAVGSSVALMHGLVPRERLPVEGVRLDLEQHPDLRAVIHEVARAMNAEQVDAVYLVPDAELGVFVQGTMRAVLRGRAQRCLVLGVAALKGLPVASLRAILAHEYGHLLHRDTDGVLALAVRRALGESVRHLRDHALAHRFNPAVWFLSAFAGVFEHITVGVSRLQEHLADAAAIDAYGSEAFETGLEHSLLNGVWFDWHAEMAVAEAVSAGHPLHNLYRYTPAAKPPTKKIKKEARAMRDREASARDTHPSPSERIGVARARAVVVPKHGDDTRDSWDLVTNQEYLEREMTHVIRQRLARSGVHLRTV